MNTTTKILFAGPKDARCCYAFAHGAGAPMDSPFMEYFAQQLGKQGIRVARFEFPYMVRRRTDNKRRPPDREPVLRETWHQVIDQIDVPNLFIGGKSMGGRIASLIANEADVAGLICQGYPFHPVGKPDKLRVDHLRELKRPTLILQGERDTFGNQDDVKSYKLPRRIRVHWLPDGDHSFKPRKSSGRSEEENWAEAVQTMADFMNQIA